MAAHVGAHPGGSEDRGQVVVTVPESYRPTKCQEVLELDTGDELILYNHDSTLVHHLNPSAGLVWRRCDGEASVREIAGHIAADHGLRGPDVLRQVAAVIAEFDALGLVEDADSLAAQPGGTSA
jgi:hypothetical protein